MSMNEIARVLQSLLSARISWMSGSHFSSGKIHNLQPRIFKASGIDAALSALDVGEKKPAKVMLGPSFEVLLLCQDGSSPM